MAKTEELIRVSIDSLSPSSFILVPLSPSGEVVRLFVMGGNQSVPKITPRDRAILEYVCAPSPWVCLS